MLNVHFCRPDEIPDAQLRFAVIAARQDGEWIFCRHRLRAAWELPGGHRERGETIDEAARRELNEETGATAFDLHPIALYVVEQNGDEVSGALYFAEVYKTEPLDPTSEIGEIRRTSVFPTHWTYPEIHPRLLRRVQEWLNLQTGADELWDLLDEDGNPTGKTHRRGDPLAPGERHLSVSVWMRNSRGEFLLTQRAANKGYPHLWECTGGAAVAGDDSLSAALRELREETGLIARPENGRRLFRFAHPDGFSDVWLFKQDFNLDDVVFQPGETCGAQCASPERILEMQSEGLLVPYDYLPELFARAKG